MLRACVALALLLVQTSAHADEGEVSLAPYLGGGVPLEGRVGVAVRVGVGDFVAVDARAGFALMEGPAASGVASLGLVLLYDVFAWVPELRIAGGGRFGEGPSVARFIGSLGVRRFISMSTSVGGSVGAEYDDAGWHGLLTLTVWWTLD